MKFYIGVNVVCPSCKLALTWQWGNGTAVLHHDELLGTEYCPNHGKDFNAPVVELTEVRRVGMVSLSDLLKDMTQGDNGNV